MAAATATNRVAAQAQQAPAVDLDSIVRATEAKMLERPELLQMRMENETIMAECRVRPRDMARIRNDLAALLKEFPDFAEAAMYCKPVGKDDDGGGSQKYATGLSIRAAEALAEVYGFNRVRADATPLNENTVKIDATFTDFQTGRIWQDGGIVSRFYKTRKKGNAAYSDDRFYNVVVKAEKSKYLREVILRSVNSALKAWFEAECAKVAGSRLDDGAIRKVVGEFRKAYAVTQEQLEKLVGKPIHMGWTKEDRLFLIGIWNTLKDGESTIAEVFGETQPTANGAAKEGPVKASDLSAPQAANDTSAVAEPTADTLFPTSPNAQ